MLHPKLPDFVGAQFFKRAPSGLQIVANAATADVACIAVGGAPKSIVVEMADGGKQYAAIVASLETAFAIGRRDVIDRVRDIFGEPRQ